MVFPAILWVYAALAAGAGEPAETRVVKDVLGRETKIAADDDLSVVPLPVVFVYDDLPPAATLKLRLSRERVFRDARVAEWEPAAMAAESIEERSARSNAVAWAIHNYSDPGPALAAMVIDLSQDATPMLAAVVRDGNGTRDLTDDLVSSYPVAAFVGLPVADAAEPHIRDVHMDRERRKPMVCGGFFMDEKERLVPERFGWGASTLQVATPQPLPSAPRPKPKPLPEAASEDARVIVTMHSGLVALDDSARKSRLRQIATNAGLLIAAVEKLPADDRKVLKEYEADARYRLGRALGYMTLPSLRHLGLVDNPAQHGHRFEQNYQALAKLIDRSSRRPIPYDRADGMNGPRYGLLTVRQHRRHGEFGQALSVVNAISDLPTTTPEFDFWLRKKRRDLYRDLKWDAWAEYEHLWLWRTYPQWMWTLEYPKEAAALRGDDGE